MPTPAAAAHQDLIVAFLRQPAATVERCSPAQFDRLLRQAAHADLLGRLACTIDRLELRGRLPAAMLAHLDGALRKLRAHAAELAREREQLRAALAPLGVPVVLLKGMAYHAAGLPPAEGRLFSDIDLLVPAHALRQVESRLLQAGWASTHPSAYDQAYYRRWMHELPPMVHVRRQSALDVHHTITPPCSRWPVSGADLLAQAQPLTGDATFCILAPADLVLHAVSHLLLNEVMAHGLRDLADIDGLLRCFAASPGFWAALVQRAAELGLADLLETGLQCAVHVLHTPVPAEILFALRPHRAGWVTRAVLLPAWRRALSSLHPGLPLMRQLTGALAEALIYVHATWVRMPPRLLARHLLIKARARRRLVGVSQQP